jgi:hypothetical protein
MQSSGALQPGEKVIEPARSAWSLGFLVGLSAAAILEAKWSEGIGRLLLELISRAVAGGIVGAIVGRVMWRPARGQVAVIKASQGLRPLVLTGTVVGVIIGALIGLFSSREGAEAIGLMTGAGVGLALGMMSAAFIWRVVRI